MGIPIRNLDKAEVGDVDLFRRKRNPRVKLKQTNKPKRKMISRFSAKSGHIAIIPLEDRKRLSGCLR